MSKYDKASLVMIPSGYKADKLYSVLPVNGNGDFDHDRNSVATRVNKDGLIETVAADIPRLDYPLIDGVVQDCTALLLEPSRTNKFLQSNNFDTSWSLASGLTLTEDSEISPDGNNNAWKLESDGSGGFLSLNQVVSVTGSNTISIFAKKGTNRYLSLRSLSGTDARAQFDLELGEIYGSSNSTASIEDYGNGWYRCIMNFSGTNNTHYFYPNIQGTADSGYIYVFGGQIEAGDYATSYIPTTTATVTRSADVCDGAGTEAEFNDSEGVLYAEISFDAQTSSTNRRVAISDGTDDNRILIQNIGSTSNRLQFYTIVNNATSTDFYTDLLDITSFNKIVFKYKINDFSVWINGFEILTDTSGATFTNGTLTELAFDGGDGNNDFYGKTKELAVFKEALTDSELEDLTSWDSFNDMAKGQLYTIE